MLVALSFCCASIFGANSYNFTLFFLLTYLLLTILIVLMAILCLVVGVVCMWDKEEKRRMRERGNEKQKQTQNNETMNDSKQMTLKNLTSEP